MAPTHILPIFTIPSTIQNADAEADGTTNVHILFGDFPSDFWIGHSQNHGSSAYSDFFTSEKNQSSIADTEADGSTNVNHDVNIPFGPWELDHDSSVYFDCSSAANRVANNELAIAEAEAYATWNANIPFSPWELDHDLSAYFDCSSAANNQSGIMSGMVEVSKTWSKNSYLSCYLYQMILVELICEYSQHFPTMDMPLDMERAPPMAPPPSMPPSLISEDDLALDLSPNYAPNLERHLEALKTCVEINATINELLLQMNGFNLKVAEMALNGLHLGLQQQQQQLSEQFQESKLPPGYICHVCFSNKHFIQHCPSVSNFLLIVVILFQTRSSIILFIISISF